MVSDKKRSHLGGWKSGNGMRLTEVCNEKNGDTKQYRAGKREWNGSWEGWSCEKK